MPTLLERLIEHQKQVAAVIFNGSLSLGSLIARHYIGVGIGFRRKGGQRTSELCLRIYVSRKLDPTLLPPAHLISGLIFGIPVDVAEVRRFVAYAGSGMPFPPATAQPGSAIGIWPTFQNTKSGTLGAVLVDQAGSRYALSANHAIARNGLPVGPTQFSIVDKGNSGNVVTPPRLVGSDVKCAPLFDGCLVDCATVKAGLGVSLKQRFPHELGAVSLTAKAPCFGFPAAKLGHSTNLTFGKVADHFADIHLNCGDGLGLVRVSQATLIEDESPHDGVASFAQPGDSGSLVFQQTAGTWAPLGLVMGGPEQNLNVAGGVLEDYIAVCGFDEILKGLTPFAPGLRLADAE